MDWLVKNGQWIFSGIGIFVLGVAAKIFKASNESSKDAIDIKQSIVLNNNFATTGPYQQKTTESELLSLPERKSKTKILFIDDDTKFKVAKILINSGWVNTSIIKDAASLDQTNIIDSHILFVDIQGVGVKLAFDSEGLGLALALKKKYPKKKVVIYSAEVTGDRFHAALREADCFLAKNADPYEFQILVERLSSEIDFS